MSLILSNAGGDNLEARMMIDPPFSCSGAGNFRLNREQIRDLAVDFSPRTTGYAEGVLRIRTIPDDRETKIKLSGRGNPAFVVNGNEASLLTVSNRSSSSLCITFSEPPAVSHPPDLLLPPYAASNVHLMHDNAAIIPGYDQENPGVMRISDGFFSTNHPLSGVQSPQSLVLEQIVEASSGYVEAGSSVNISFGISNPAASARSVFWKLSDQGGHCPDDWSAFLTLPPRGRVRLSRVWIPRVGGSNALTLTVSEEGDKHSVPLTRIWNFNVVSRTAPPVPANHDSAGSGELLRPQSIDAVGRAISPLRQEEQIPIKGSPIPEIAMTYSRSWLANPDLIISWQKGLSIREAEVWRQIPSVALSAPDLLVRNDKFSPELMFEQEPQKFVSVTKEGLITSLLISGLPPGAALFKVHLIGDGDCGDFESLVSIEIPPPRSFRPILYMIIALALSGAIFRIFKRIR